MKILSQAIRSNFFLYRLFRKMAPMLCRYLILEDGFKILASIRRESTLNKVMVDIGSNDGTSIEMMRQFFPRSKIYAFEPILTIPNRFRKIEENGLLDWNNVALGRQEGKTEIFTPIINGKKFDQFSSTDKDAILENTEKYLRFKKESIRFVSQIVQVETVDYQKIRPFFIKIDVEGNELNVLEGARQTIYESKPIILVEINDSESYSEIISFMESISYKKKYLNNFNPKINNYVFVYE
jgi:FkbM family methyltransferase